MGTDLNKELGQAGAGVTFTVKDLVKAPDGIENEVVTSWTVSPLVQGTKASFSAFVQENAREAALESELFYRRKARKIRKELIDNGDLIEDEEREKLIEDIRDLEASATQQMSEFNTLRTACRFHFNDNLCQTTLNGIVGSIKIAELLLKPKHPNITFSKAEKLFDSHQKEIRQAIKEVQDLGKSSTSPKSVGDVDVETPSKSEN